MRSKTKSNGVDLQASPIDLYKEPSDSDLITKLQFCTDREREEILLTLYERYKGLVLKICFHYLGDYEQSNDIFHDVFIRVIEHAGKLKNPAVFKSWLLTITRNLCIDRLRKMSYLKNQEPLTTEIEVQTDSRIEDRYIAEIEKDRILIHLSNCIQSLDESLLIILKLRWKGLKAAQISKIVCMNRMQLRSSYRKIRKTLESFMEKQGVNINIDQIITLGEC